jgi:hypothetical protein
LLGGNGDRDMSTGEGRVGGAGGFALDDGLNGGKIVLQGAQKDFKADAAELLGVAEETAGEIIVVVTGARGVRAMARAERLAAFGDAAAFAAGFIDVLAFGNHGASFSGQLSVVRERVSEKPTVGGGSKLVSAKSTRGQGWGNRRSAFRKRKRPLDKAALLLKNLPIIRISN